MGDDWSAWQINSRTPRRSQSSVAPWEKTFCTSVCSIPWETICAAKDVIDCYTNIAEWDDSAALEVFQDAKARYWAEINGLPRDIPLPDPNIYIDEVDDHTSVIDAELLADLYRKPPPCPPDEDRDSLRNLPIEPTGWGDLDDNPGVGDGFITLDAFIEKPLPAATGWGPVDDNLPASDSWNENGQWDDNGAPRVGKPLPAATGWGPVDDNLPASDSWNENGQWDDNGARSGGSWRGTADKHQASKHGQFWSNGNVERGGRNGMKRNGHSSRFSKPRHQVNDNERTVRAGRPLATQQWKPKQPCGPIDGQISAQAAWHGQKI